MSQELNATVNKRLKLMREVNKLEPVSAKPPSASTESEYCTISNGAAENSEVEPFALVAVAVSLVMSAGSGLASKIESVRLLPI
jgi:hypothetical protein